MSRLRPGMAFKFVARNWVDMIIGVKDVAPEKVRIYIMRMIGEARPEIFSGTFSVKEHMYQFDWELTYSQCANSKRA